MRKKIILLMLMLATFSFTGCVSSSPSGSPSNMESSSVESAENNPDEAISINAYEFPELCMELEGKSDIAEFEEIDWYVWMAEEEPMEVAQMPHDAEELQEMLHNCLVEVIKVPKELIPVYSLYLHVTNGTTFAGEDEANYYYYVNNVKNIRVIEPGDGEPGNYLLVREGYIENSPREISAEEYLGMVCDDISAVQAHNLNTISDPRLIYMPLYADDVATDFTGTIVDSEWVEHVQWARKA